MAIKDVFHVNVNCTNLERSRAFYELVGFKVVTEIPLGGSKDMLEGLGLPAGGKAKALLMMLEPDKPRGTRIDLIEWVEPATKGTTPPDLAHVGGSPAWRGWLAWRVTLGRLLGWTEASSRDRRPGLRAPVRAFSRPC